MNTQPQVPDLKIPLKSEYEASAIMRAASKLSYKIGVKKEWKILTNGLNLKSLVLRPIT